ncbi:ABC transporter permease [Leadbettera azotonutricia]|uniref:Protein LplB n=1 Tax=Leadbettera azotonutricia (strain ATCC BAA-888 / DSM 13862 / ZAS-9) TaxID=545695 RepID=F5Y960_LEAAZ|nr:ABC transporter permease subunit [Leadbettera azotonutricia]AEF80480.1 protein LplB [Leadbettera azotonutricia ZAS-9]
MTVQKNNPLSRRQNLWRNLKRDRMLILLALPAVLYFAVFHYLPMIGTVIAFQNFRPGAGLFSSSWVGIRWFKEFFSSIFFSRLLVNTFLLSFYMLIFAFPVPIIFALMLCEVKDGLFRRTIQAISFLPHFISLVVVVGILQNFLSISDGVINQFRGFLGFKAIGFLDDPGYFRMVYVVSGIWQEFGWNSIVYIAAIAGISPQLYEAARIDGCSRFRQMIHITLPGIMPAAVTLLILHLGKMMSVGFEKIILMYSPSTYSVADVLSTYVYRRGIVDMQFSYAGAVDLFNSVINLVLLLAVNRISRRRTGVGLF